MTGASFGCSVGTSTWIKLGEQCTKPPLSADRTSSSWPKDRRSVSTSMVFRRGMDCPSSFNGPLVQL